MIAFGLLASGCGFRLGYDLGDSCTETGDCTDGAACLTGVCVGLDPEAPDAGSDVLIVVPDAAPEVAPDAGPATAVGCGSMFLVDDDFTGPALDPRWVRVAPAGATVFESGGHLAVALAAGSAPIEAGYRSRMAYDLRSSALAVSVPRVAGQMTAIEVRDFDGGGAGLGFTAGTLVAVVLDGGSRLTRVSTVYDPVAHAHWRLRESGGVLHWETSADRLRWTALHAEPLPTTGSLVRAVLLVRGQTAAAGEAWFDAVNGIETTVPGHCGASSISDDFDDGTIDRSYNSWVDFGGCSTREVGGVLELSFTGSGDAWCGTETSYLVDLRDDAIGIEVVTAPGAPLFTTFFEAVTLTGDKLEIGRGPEGLYMQLVVDGATLGQTFIPYDRVAHRFWRLREAGGTVYLDTSSDGTTWINRWSHAAVFAVDAVLIDMAAGHWQPGPQFPVVARYDRLGVR